MRTGRFALVGVVVSALVTTACASASGADRVAVGAVSPAPASSAPAARLLPRVEAGSAGLGTAVTDAIEATRRVADRVAAAEATEVEGREEDTPPPARDERRQSSDGDCARQAMAAGRFDPSCSVYQGYLDPGTVAGRPPTSGELQMQYACEQGLVPESDC